MRKSIILIAALLVGAGPSLGQAERVFNEGVEASNEGDRETAKAKFLKSVEMDPTFTWGYLALATLHFEAGDHEAALAAADQTIALEPDNVRAHRIRYEVLTKLGRKDEASKEAAILGKLDSSADSVAIVFNEGVTAFREDDMETAKTNFLRALEMQPDLSAAMSALAVVYLQESNYAEAAEMCERFLAVNPGDPKVLQMQRTALAALAEASDGAADEGDGQEVQGERAVVLKARSFKNDGSGHLIIELMSGTIITVPEEDWSSQWSEAVDKTVKNQEAEKVARSSALPPSDAAAAAMIRTHCAKEWPDDFSMRKYCEDEQYEGLRALRAREMLTEVLAKIRSKCRSEWLDDFQMREYCENQQLEALRELNQ